MFNRKLNKLNKNIQDIRDELNVALKSNKQNDSAEMFGFYNGVIFTLSMIYEQEPAYLTAPQEWDEVIEANKEALKEKEAQKEKVKKDEKKEKKPRYAW